MEERSPHKEVHANLVGGLNEHGSHRLICLNVWSHWWNYLGRIRNGHVGESVSLGIGLEVSKTDIISC